ncbi:hypothetical protein [Fusobacterium mortiferum]|uniref:hypothetical protein n=1 Tax=Fusobacterium mortiferum TaxID=850 RepID=UPI003F8F8634
MKKYVLGAMMLVGAMAYGQANRVIVPVEGGNATANIPVEVTGQVFDPAQLSLVVDLKSSQSADGTGFAFKMPHLWKDSTEKVTANGEFDVKVMKGTSATDLAPVEIDGTLEVSLKAGITETSANAGAYQSQGVSGTAADTTLKYVLTGEMNGTNTLYNGLLAVEAMAGSTVGTFSDTSVKLVVDLSGQAAGTN